MKRWLFVLVALGNVHGSCGPKVGCTNDPMPVTMTEARARVLAPAVETGLAVSTTHIFGDCRPMDPVPSEGCDVVGHPACARERAPLRVLVLELNQSVPRAPECGGFFAVDDLAARAVFDGVASDGGELVIELAAGNYTVYASADDACAVCGLSDGDGTCRVEVVARKIVAKALIVDEATR